MQTRSRLILALRKIEQVYGDDHVEIVACPECHLAVRVVETAVSAPREWAGKQAGAEFGAVYMGDCVCGATVVVGED